MNIITKHVHQYKVFYIGGWLVAITISLSQSAIYCITLNRLLSFIYPLRYRTMMTKNKFFIINGTVCVLVTSVNICGVVLVDQRIAPLEGGVLKALGYLVYFVFAWFTYIRIFVSIIQLDRRESRTQHECCEGERKPSKLHFIFAHLKREGYLIPLLITSSYLLFVVVPVIADGVCTLTKGFGSRCSFLSFHVWLIGYSVNTVSDAVIYVFCDQDIWSHLKSKFTFTHQEN